jgi:hypothetical protein
MSDITYVTKDPMTLADFNAFLKSKGWTRESVNAYSEYDAKHSHIEDIAEIDGNDGAKRVMFTAHQTSDISDVLEAMDILDDDNEQFWELVGNEDDLAD